MVGPITSLRLLPAEVGLMNYPTANPHRKGPGVWGSTEPPAQGGQMAHTVEREEVLAITMRTIFPQSHFL